MDYKDFYNKHETYVKKRDVDSSDYKQYLNEIYKWKIPFLSSRLIAGGISKVNSVIEIGCGTGDLIGLLPSELYGDASDRIGIDISTKNIEVAQEKYPHIQFKEGTEDILGEFNLKADLIILCDILEHVPNENEFLNLCRGHSKYILVNIPLEKCFINRKRIYGENDKAGHLRNYSLTDAIGMLEKSGYNILNWKVASYVCQKVFVENFKLKNMKNNKRLTWKLKLLIFLLLQKFPPIVRLIYGANFFALLEGE